MRFSVSVPVLSEQMTLTEPIVSHATIFLTSAFSLDIFMMLSARAIAMMVGRPSGTDATMRTMLVINASEIVSKLAVPLLRKVMSWIRKTTSETAAPSTAMNLPSRAIFSCSGVEVLAVEESS